MVSRLAQPFPATRTILAGILSCLLLCLLPGCVSDQKKPSRPAATAISAKAMIDEINLLAIPVALNFDQTPGADGVVLKVYAGNRRQPRPVPIESGTLELLMFDGILKPNAQDNAPPLRVWSYKAGELKRYEMKTSIGTGYQIAAQWGEAKPTQDRVSIIARYLSPDGLTILSAPSVISVTGN